MSIIIVVWFVCTQIGYIHAHLLAGTQLFCPRIIWNITASERLFKITKNKRTGGKKSSVEGKKKKNNGGCQCHGSDIHDSDMFARFAKMIRFVEETHDPNKSTPLPHNSLSLHLLSSSSCCHQQSSFYTHASKSCSSSSCKGNLNNVHCVFVLIVVYIC